MPVAESSIMELPSRLIGITAAPGGRGGPLTEWNPSFSRYKGRMPRSGGSGCGASSVSCETSLNSHTASGVNNSASQFFVSGEKKKNLHVIHD